ncbi:hypothetical protein Q7P35_005319 [Cladosporium inversicolor]
MSSSPTEKSFDGSTLGSRENTDRDQGKDLELGRTEDEPNPKVRGWRRLFARSPGAVKPKVTKPITQKVEDCPQGYPRLAEFLSSDRSFMQYRGFGALHSRLLLAQQCDIETLERELNLLDDWDSKTEGMGIKLKFKACDDRARTKESLGADFPYRRSRPEVIAELKQCLMDYDAMLLKARDVASLQRPSDRDWRSVKHWILEKAPLIDREQQFILRKEDLVTLRSGREGAGFESLVERMLSRTDKVLQSVGCNIIQYLFVTPELREKTSDTLLNYYAPKRVDKLVNVIIAAVIFVLLILPVVAMYELSNVSQRASPFEAIGILIIFTLLFGTAMSSLTKATRQELFAASAAYCAVLVVFISNFSTQTVEIAQ